MPNFFPLLFHNLTFNLFLWCFVGGNFCAGYDLKELAHNSTTIKLKQDVTKGPGPMVCSWKQSGGKS